MEDLFWLIFGWILKIIGYLSLTGLFIGVFYFLMTITTNGGRKWYYYNPNKPWKGGYWTPLLPRYPPYNNYEWNPKTCRFEHKETGEPLFPWDKAVVQETASFPKKDVNDDLHIPQRLEKLIKERSPKKRRPEWLRFLLEETPATLLEKHRRKQWAKQRDEI